MKTLLLSKENVAELASMEDTILAVEEAYRAFSSGQVEQPDYLSIHLPEPGAEIDFKLGFYKTNQIISMKASSGGFANNPLLHGLPSGMGCILLFDARTGALICMMDGSLMTGLRTGAAGAASVKLLARKDARKIASIGAGNQARMQIRAISKVMEIQEVHVWCRTPATISKFKSDIEEELGIPVTAAGSARDAVGQADILVTTTRGTGPLVDAAWIRPGTHIVAIGADQKGKQELDPEIFGNAKIVVDSVTQCCEKGETANALNAMVISRNDIHAEIGEILLGNKAGRQNDDEVTIFDATGMAIQDNAATARIYQQALERATGTWFEFFRQ